MVNQCARSTYPAAESHQFGVCPSRSMQLSAARYMAMVLVTGKVTATLESTAAPCARRPNRIVVALEEELGMVPWALVVGVREAGAWSEVHNVLADLVGMHIFDDGVSLSVQIGSRW